ncbi:MAG TPA: flagellar biosynthesis protein FliQ [Chloroflexota bacterium]|jgi:flagellar biosynthetic protein FliQ|nr:flagellar biosynthesis protein FliQ [Chloroflexota bacterium]
MTQNAFLDVIRHALTLTLMLSAPVLGFGLAVGLAVSIFQAVTQINEMTLAYIPKILAVFVALAIFGPWMLQMMLSFSSNIFMSLPGLVK